jgi:hypothetical protein
MRRPLATAPGEARSAPAARLGSGRSHPAGRRRQTRLEAQAQGTAAIQAWLGPKFTPHLAVETVETLGCGTAGAWALTRRVPATLRRLARGGITRTGDVRKISRKERELLQRNHPRQHANRPTELCEHAFVTSQGSLRHQFQRALERGSAFDAISAAKAMGGLSLGDALALCVVIAERNPQQHERAAGRWISRFLEETPDASLEEVQLVTAALTALRRAPELARPVLRELIRHRNLSTVESVFADFAEV